MLKFNIQLFADVTITEGGTYTVDASNSTITIATDAAVTLSGGSSTALSEVVIKTTAENANLTINNLNITNYSNAIITLGEGSGNKFNFTGTNTLTVENATNNQSGACVNVGGGVTVNGTGKLNATSFGGSCIGVDSAQNLASSNITIESGTYDLAVAKGACAIGGAGSGNNAIGNILITGTADITAKVPNGYAAAVGASYRGSCGNITITGDSKVNASVGYATAAIGAGAFTKVGDITINGNATVTAENTDTLQSNAPAGIGSGIGAKCTSIGNIVIGGNAKVTTTSVKGLAIDNHEWYRENPVITAPETENDHAIENTDATITIGENATFSGTSGDKATDIVINGETLYAATINYNSADGLTYSGGEKPSADIDTVFLEITSGGNYTIAENSVGIVKIKTTDAVTIKGGDYTLENVRILTESATADLTIENLKIYNPENSVIRLGASAGNKLTVKGENDFSNNVYSSAIINVGGGVDIDGDGSLKIVSTNGTPIGTDKGEDLGTSNITISGGTFDLLNKSGGACIGGCGNSSKIGDITITGTSNVKASVPKGYAAAIGGGYQGTVASITINGDATVDASAGQVGSAIGGASFGTVGDITIGGRASVVASGDDPSFAEAAIGGNSHDKLKAMGNITVTDDATVIASSAYGLAINNLVNDTPSANPIRFYSDSLTANQSVVMLINGNSSDKVTIGANSYSPLMGNRDVYSAYQGDKMVFYDGALAMTGDWTSLSSNSWSYNSIVQRDLMQNFVDKSAQFTIGGGNLKDEDGDGIPDNVSIGSIIYIQQSGVHTNISHLSGNVVYNGNALGIENDDDYNIEAISPIDLSETFGGTYITDPNVTAMRGISNGATISPRGTAGTSTASDWISLDSTDCTVTFMDGAYCVYTENKFSSRAYTQLSISNNNKGVLVSAADDLIQTISGLEDGYALTIESGINVGEKINFETSGSGTIVVKTTANSGKYSLKADSDEWQYQRYTVSGDNEFTFIFGENGSVVGTENFDGQILSEGTWVTLSGGNFEYTGSATNDISKSVTFTVGGASINNTDNLEVTKNMYFEALNANRVGLNGLNGNASIDNVALGVEGDTMYAAHFATSGESAENIAVLNISDGATVNNNFSVGADENAQIKFSDGAHTLFTQEYMVAQNFTTINASNGGEGFSLNVDDGTFGTISGLNDGYKLTVVAGGNISDSLAINTDGGAGVIEIQNGDITETFNLGGGDEEFVLQFNDNSVELVNYEGWVPTSSKGVYEYVSDLATVTISGADLTDSDNNGVPDNVSVEIVKSGYITSAIIKNLSGEVSVNNKFIGVSGDDNYEAHLTVYVDDDAPDKIKSTAYNLKTLMYISDGASLSVDNGNVVNFDSNGKFHISDGGTFYLQSEKYTHSDGSTKTRLDFKNGGKGLDLTVENDTFKAISGLNDGYEVTISTGGNCSDSLKIIGDGGTLNFDNVNLELDGDTNLYFTDRVNGGKIDLSGENTGSIIISQGSRATVTGGSGNDTLIASGKYNYLSGGAGEDTFLRGSRENTKLITVNDFTEDEDEVYHGRPFADFSLLSVAKSSGNDYVFSVGGSTIKYIDGANKKLKFVDVNGDIAYFGNYLTILDCDPKETNATAKVKVMDATARTENIYLKGNALDNTIYGGNGNDTISLGGGADVYIYQGGNDLIQDYQSGRDTIQLNFSDITGSTVNGSDVVLTTAKGNVTLKSAKDKLITFVDDAGNTTEKYFFADTSYTPLETGLSYNATRTILAVNNKFGGEELNLENYLSSVEKVNASALSKGVNIVGNDLNNSIKGGKGDDEISGGKGNDKILGNNGNDVLNGGTGNNTLIGGNGADIFVYGGGNDLITDYKPGKDKIQLDSNLITSSTVEGSNVILTTDEGNITVKSAKDNVVTFTNDDKDTNLIFFADTFYTPLETGLRYNSKRTILTASSKFDGNEINLENYLPSVEKVNASAVTQNLKIVGNDLNNSINGGKGNDEISGGKGNDTLTGGAGNDLFVYGGGNDLITDYKPGKDKIQLDSNLITSSTVEGSNVILTTAEGNITVKSAKDNVVTFTNGDKDTNLIFFADTFYTPLETGLRYNSKRTILTASSKFDGNEINLENYLPSVEKVNASAVTQNLKIVGNDNDNTINGGKDDDEISGGKGNDTLTGGAGNDLFVYSGGNDVITDYKAGEDSIKIDGTISETTYSGKNVIFTFGDSTLTVKNAKGKEITINGETQIYSRTFDILEDNNFVTDELTIDEICEETFEVTQIQNTNAEIVQSENILTFTEDK